jgi:hypothetical protein
MTNMKNIKTIRRMKHVVIGTHWTWWPFGYYRSKWYSGKSINMYLPF